MPKGYQFEAEQPYTHALDDPARDLFHTTFLGVTAVQQWTDLLLWEQFLNSQPGIRRIVELGTGSGGFAMFLALQARQRGISFTTVDKLEKPGACTTPIGQELLGSRFRRLDIFGEGRAVVEWLIREPEAHPLVLFCDDGDKPREMREFAPICLPGDFVVVHDWGTEATEQDLPGLPLRPTFTVESEGLLARTRFFVRLADA